jgi:hypothetical protein
LRHCSLAAGFGQRFRDESHNDEDEATKVHATAPSILRTLALDDATNARATAHAIIAHERSPEKPRERPRHAILPRTSQAARTTPTRRARSRPRRAARERSRRTSTSTRHPRASALGRNAHDGARQARAACQGSHIDALGVFRTPSAAQQALWVVTQMTPKKGEELFKRLGNMTPSKSSLDRLPKLIAECWEDDRKAFECALRDGLEIPDGTVSIAVLLDGVPRRSAARTAPRRCARRPRTKGG